jgi:hypothetical protein
MPTCPACHNEIELYTNPCPHCGAGLNWPAPAPSPPPVPSSTKALEQYDRMMLQERIDRLVRDGYRVVSQTETTAQLVKPKVFSFGAALIALILGVFPLLIYLFVYAAESDRQLYLRLADGKVIETKSGGPNQAAQLLGTLLILLIVAGGCLILLYACGGTGGGLHNSTLR